MADLYLSLVNTTEYYYDALGRRVAKNIQIQKNSVVESFNQTFSYLADEEKIFLSKNGNNGVTQYVDGQGIDEHLGEVTSVRAMSYISDRFSGNANQEAFGLDKNSTPVIYGYAGREYDLESGFYYNRARMYNAEMGRFISKDPIGFGGGDENLYRYVENNPQNYFDPAGYKKLPADHGAWINSSSEGVDLLVNSYVDEYMNKKIMTKILNILPHLKNRMTIGMILIIQIVARKP
jgi:RHS repeat-associated protein